MHGCVDALNGCLFARFLLIRCLCVVVDKNLHNEFAYVFAVHIVTFMFESVICFLLFLSSINDDCPLT